MKNSLVKRVQKLEGEMLPDDDSQNICDQLLAGIKARIKERHSPEELNKIRQDLRERIAAQIVPISGMLKFYSEIYGVDQNGENHDTQPNK